MEYFLIGISLFLFAPLAFLLLVTFIVLFVRKNRLRKHFAIAAGLVAGLSVVLLIVGIFNVDWSAELADAEERNAEREEQRLAEEAAEAEEEAERIAQEEEAEVEAERIAEEEAEAELLAEEAAAAEAK